MFAHRHMRRRHKSQRGQAYTEFIIVLPLFLIIIAGVIGFGQALYTKLAMEAAAWSACRHAVATLNQNRGVEQALRATRYTLSGFGLNPNNARAQVIYWGGWGRGPLSCSGRSPRPRPRETLSVDGGTQSDPRSRSPSGACAAAPGAPGGGAQAPGG